MKRSFLILLVASLALPACEAIRHDTARREDTVEGYRRFLAQFPGSQHKLKIKDRLEALEFKRARAADRPIAYRMYLERYPSGRYVEPCRRRLARLALDRAKSAADLRLIVEQFEDTPEGAEARKRLPAMLAAAVLASGDEAALLAFIQRYPGQADAARVKAALARLRHSRLGDDRHELEAFARDLAGTPEAERARKKAQALLEKEVADTGSDALLRELRSRYPRSPRIGDLKQVVALKQAHTALAAMDMKALAASGVGRVGTVETARVMALCKRRPAACREVAELARAAMPWRPPGGLAALRGAVFGQDILAGWQAIEALGWAPDFDSARLLTELLGSARLSTARLAARSLARWVSRAGGDALNARWLAGQLRRTPRRGNDDEAQRHGYLSLLVGQEQPGRQLLETLSVRPGRALPAAALLCMHDISGGKKPPADLLARLIQAAELRLKILVDGFPAELNDESGVAAVLAERELFSMVRVLALLLEKAGPNEALSRVHASAADALARWQNDLSRDVKGFRPAVGPGMADAVERHDLARPAALRRLRRGRDPASRAAAVAVGALQPASAAQK